MSDIDLDQLMDQLSKKARAAPQMVQAMVELTYGCNLRCVHCYNPTHEAKNELSTDEVLRTLDGLAAQGCLRVGFTGGEVFTRRDAVEIMRHGKRLGLLTNILTNATTITPALADQIRLLEPYQVDISVYGATAETYERVTRVPGSFARFVRGVDLLADRRVPVLLKLVLLTLNVHEHHAMREFARARSLPYQANTEIHPNVDGSLEPLTYRLPPHQAFEVWREESGESVLQRQMEQPAASPCRPESSSPEPSSPERSKIEEGACGFAEGVFHCRCGKTSAAATPYGKLNLCLSIYHPQYDLTTGSLKEGWNQLVDLVNSANPGPSYECDQCPLTPHCTRGTGDGWLEQGTFDGPCIPYFRDLAERKTELLGYPVKEGIRRE